MISCCPHGLGCGGTDGVRRSLNDRFRKGVGSLLLPTTSSKPEGVDAKFNVTVCGSRKTLLVSVRFRSIRHGQFDLEVRRVFMVRCWKGSRCDAGELLNEVRATVRGTMMQDNFPRKRRRGERTLARRSGVSGECNRLAHLPLSARNRRINKCCGAPCLDRDVFDVRRSMIVCHFELHVVEISPVCRCRRSARSWHRRKIPSPFRSQEYVRVSPVFGSLEALPSKVTVRGSGPRQRRGLNDGIRGLIAAGELDASDGPSVEVHIEQVASWPNLQVDGIRGAGHKRGSGRRIGQAVRPGEHAPNTIPGMVGKEQRALIRGGIGPPPWLNAKS